LRVRRAQLRGTVERHGEALALLKKPGDMVLVVRGVPRMLVFACPDGCGDVLPVNLDSRADKAWRLYQREGTNTLFPSVWRDEGCGAHFILWDDIIYWNGFDDEPTLPAELKKAVLSGLKEDEFLPFFEIAQALDEIPWAVHVVCHDLVRENIAVEGVGRERGTFKLR